MVSWHIYLWTSNNDDDIADDEMGDFLLPAKFGPTSHRFTFRWVGFLEVGRNQVNVAKRLTEFIADIPFAFEEEINNWQPPCSLEVLLDEATRWFVGFAYRFEVTTRGQ